MAASTHTGTSGIALLVTPSDTVALPGPTGNGEQKCRGLYVGTTGNITVKFEVGGPTLLFTAVPAGLILPISPALVMSTNTTAATIVALY